MLIFCILFIAEPFRNTAVGPGSCQERIEALHPLNPLQVNKQGSSKGPDLCEG